MPRSRALRGGRLSSCAVLAVLLVAACPVMAHAQGHLPSGPVPDERPGPTAGDLADMSLEQLGNVEVTSVSRRVERLADAAASIYVITGEEIRRSGARTLPAILRLAPNLQVARADADQWAISARGYNSVLANKLLVMIDGRTVYSPLFSGVFWEAQDVLLSDIDRVEVISGPGGSMWGTNAVTGVIHVITRSARDTHGALVDANAGTESDRLAARYGGGIGARGHYRVYGRALRLEDSERGTGAPVEDDSRGAQGGFRSDWINGRALVTVQGDAYATSIDQAGPRRELNGANVLGRWTVPLRNGYDTQLQTYFDHTERDQPGAIREVLNTVDAQYQQTMRWYELHDLLLGAGARYYFDRVTNVSGSLGFLPPDRDLRVLNVFAQDQFHVLPSVDLSVGLKLEHNEYTGAEWMPNARVGWKARTNGLLWASLSRAVRAPSRIDRDVFLPLDPPHTVLDGGPDFRSEISNTAELGWRAQPNPALSYALTAFVRRTRRLRSLEPTPDGPQFRNGVRGRSEGIEAWSTWRVRSWWKLTAGGVAQRLSFSLEPGATDLQNLTGQGDDPQNWITARSSMDLGRALDFDVMSRWIGALPDPAVPAYATFDARLAWWMRPGLELSVAGENLAQPNHAEWGAEADRSVVERSVSGRLTWRLP